MSIGQPGVGPAQGLSPSTLELLANPTKLEKTLKSLRDAEEKATKTIELAGPAAEIVTLRAEAGTLYKAAEEANAQALLDAEAIVEEGNVQAQLIVDKATQEANREKAGASAEIDEVKKLIATKEASIAAVELKLNQRLVELQKDEDDLDDREADLDATAAELDVRAADLETLNVSLLKEKTKLAGAREQIDAALG